MKEIIQIEIRIGYNKTLDRYETGILQRKFLRSETGALRIKAWTDSSQQIANVSDLKTPGSNYLILRFL
jgi:hypothetical protein